MSAFALQAALGITVAPAFSQTAALPPPAIMSLDANQVDMISNSWHPSNLPSISSAGITWQTTGLGKQDNLTAVLNNDPSSSASFASGSLVIGAADGATAQYGGQGVMSCASNSPGVGTCTLNLPDGTQVIYDKTKTSNMGIQGSLGVATQIIKPDGEILTYTYQPWGPYSGGGGPYSYTIWAQIPLSVSSSLGWMVKYSTPAVTSISGVYIVNTSEDYCDPASTSDCTGSDSSTWPRISVTAPGGDALAYKDILGNTTTIAPGTTTSGPHKYYTSVVSINYPSGRNAHILYDTHQWPTATFTRGSASWTYTPPDSSPYASMNTSTTVADPLGNVKILYHEATNGAVSNARPTSFQDEVGRVTKYVYSNAVNGATRIISPEATYSGSTLTGGYTDYAYDGRNNITSVTVVPAGGGTPQVTQAGYPSTCSNVKTCNKPTYIIDPKGNETDYTYDSASGNVLTETGPADATGVRPQKRYSYTQLYPKVKNSAGALVNSPAVWRLTRISTCRSATTADPASCVGTVNELVTTYAYNDNHLLLTSETISAGDGSSSATTSYGYDKFGRRIWVDGPRTDVDDKSYTTYDLLGRPVYEIGVLPGGSNSPHRTVIHHVYDVDGHEIRIEMGYANSNATDGSDFVVTSFKRMTFDSSSGLLVKTEVVQP